MRVMWGLETVVGNEVGSLMRVLSGMVTTLFLPGYALLFAIWPGKKQLTIIERVVLSFGLSMAIVPLLLYPLSFLSWGVQTCSVNLTVLGFIVIMFLVAYYRQRRMPAKQRAVLSRPFPRPSWNKMPSPDRAFVAASVIVAVFTLALLAGFYGTSKVGGVTEFYVLGPDGKTGRYPETVVGGEKLDLIVGVGNYEQEETAYTIYMDIDGKNTTIVGPLKLGPEENWERCLKVPVLTGRGKKIVELRLMREGMKQVYRNLYFWLDVK